MAKFNASPMKKLMPREETQSMGEASKYRQTMAIYQAR